jgi:hypothetical protein
LYRILDFDVAPSLLLRSPRPSSPPFIDQYLFSSPASV